MPRGTSSRRPFEASLKANLIAGFLTVIPLIVVWVVFDFVLTALAAAGRPLAVATTEALAQNYPALAPFLANETLRWIAGVLAALLVLYAVGAVANRVVGQRIIGFFERVIVRIPLVETIYSAAKKLIDVLRQKPSGGQRVVLIEFPRPGLMAIGFVTRIFTDARDGRTMAAVFVPTAPNPTTGYVALLPADQLSPTDLSPEAAMTMILSGGAVIPDTMSVVRPPIA